MTVPRGRESLVARLVLTGTRQVPPVALTLRLVSAERPGPFGVPGRRPA
ncbi:hypothetical protein [Longispora fulva]|uniref:Uncharacterized protein n=1 Tax=Longispora fulva TaxID=619741 RepID=A0A8J7KQB4_9ACTN|nr:hypothetical protein [Longispora fulva]MBG6137217.1 hypothetical protein [Longispora fulva]